jgi:hypothetical protein
MRAPLLHLSKNHPDDQKSCKKGDSQSVSQGDSYNCKKGGCAWPAAVAHTHSLSLPTHSLALSVELVDPAEWQSCFSPRFVRLRCISLCIPATHFLPARTHTRTHTYAPSCTPFSLQRVQHPPPHQNGACTASIHPAGQPWPHRADSSPIVKVAFGHAWTDDVVCALHGLQVCKTIACACTSKNVLRG